jgi:hypothetical protein
MTKNPAVTPEPAPVVTDSPVVWPFIIRDLDNLSGPLWLRAKLREDMTARHEAGMEKYGIPLHLENGRIHAIDAYQEALDGSAYSRAEAMKTGSPAWWHIHRMFLELAASIRYQIALDAESEPRFQSH